MTNRASRFFKAPFYDRKVAQYTEDTKQPSGVVETITARATNNTSPAYNGAIMVMIPTLLFLKTSLTYCLYSL